jgi:hypothetical protein
MINTDINRDINERLSKLYLSYSDAYLKAYTDTFKDSAPPPRINEFGIIDVNKYNADKGILFIAKETNGWDNETFAKEIHFRDWMHGISTEGVSGKGHIQKHPTMWYNLGRWAMILSNPELDLQYIRSCKSEALKAIGEIAFTNINKVRGKNKSKHEYYTLAYADISGEILRKEFEIIKPKIIVCCGTYNEVMHHAPDYQHIAIKMPHPCARISCERMLSRIVEHLVLS